VSLKTQKCKIIYLYPSECHKTASKQYKTKGSDERMDVYQDVCKEKNPSKTKKTHIHTTTHPPTHLGLALE
jgi:hypothetical protein